MELPKKEIKEYKDCGFCSYCLMTIESKQPGGTDVRHKGTLTPYLLCEQAKRVRGPGAK